MPERIALGALAALALAACGGSTTADTDAGGGTLPPATEEAVQTSGLALGIAAALTGPLVVPAEGLRDSGGRLDGAMRETRTRTDVESGSRGCRWSSLRAARATRGSGSRSP